MKKTYRIFVSTMFQSFEIILPVGKEEIPSMEEAEFILLSLFSQGDDKKYFIIPQYSKGLTETNKQSS